MLMPSETEKASPPTPLAPPPTPPKPVAPQEKAQIVTLTNFLLSMALAAMGLETDFAKLKQEGLKPLALAACAWVFIAGFSLALVKLFA